MDETSIAPLERAQCEEAGRIVASNPLWADRYRYPAERARADLDEALARGDLVLGAAHGALVPGATPGPAGELVGFAWVLPKGAFGRYPYLRLIAVSAGAQGGGAGQRLLAEVEARVRPSRQLLLMVSDFNEGAQRFYARNGYAQVGSCPDFLVDGIAEQIWMKRL